MSDTDYQPLTSRSSLFSNLRIVSLGTLLSRILGMARDIGMASLFGAGTVLDAFILAFRLPNLTRQLFGEGALTTAFLPIFVRELESEGREAARATLSAVAFALGMFLFALIVIGESVSLGILWSMDVSDSTRLLIELFMIFWPYMLFICMSALFCAALHSMKQFLWPALVPVVLNVVWLIGIVAAYFQLQDDPERARFVAGCLTFAGMLQMLLPAFLVQRHGVGWTKQWRDGWKHVREVFAAMVPVIAGLSILHVNSILDSVIAWSLAKPESGEPAWCEMLGISPILEPGTTTALYIGQRMFQFPLGVFGLALGTVLYPVLTRHALRGETDLLRHELSRGLRLVLAVAIPASLGLALLASPITNLLFRHGQFTADDARLSSQMIAVYGLGVWIYILLTILNRAFYALNDRMTPLRFGLVALVTNLILNVILVWSFGGIGLAIASVMATTLQVGLTTHRLHVRIEGLPWKEIRIVALLTLIVTAVMGLACYGVLSAFPDSASMIARGLRLLVPLLVGAGVYGVLGWLVLLKRI